MAAGLAESAERDAALDAKVTALEDRLVSRTELLRWHVADPTAHGCAT